MNEKQPLQHIPGRCILLCVGFVIMAFGVAFSIKAALGTSPISSVPYVTSAISGLSVGVTTIIMNCIFVLIQILILRRRYQWVQLLQIPAAVLFGVMIDVSSYAIQGITYTNYFQQWILCVIGIVFVAIGVSIEVTAKLITTAGEGIVLAICQVLPVKFGNMKVAFDVTLVCLSIITSFVFLGHLDGVREGTVAAAVCVGLLTKQFRKPFAKFEERYLMEKLPKEPEMESVPGEVEVSE